MTEEKINQTEKRKFALWISKDTINRAKKTYKDDNCSSTSEFIEKAVLFYLGLPLHPGKPGLPGPCHSRHRERHPG